MRSKLYEYIRRHDKDMSMEEIREEAHNHIANYAKTMNWPSNVTLDIVNMGDAGEHTTMYAHIFYEEKK